MKKIFLFLLVLVGFGAHAQIKYEEYFTDNTLRFDYNRCGTSTSEVVSFMQMKQEGKWSGPRNHLIDPFAWGEYRVELYDRTTKKLIFSRGYAGLYSEWQTTAEAKVTPRCFYETALVPFPKKPVTLQLYSRDRKTKLIKTFEYQIDPANYFISKESGPIYKSYMVHDSGDPSEKIDVVFLPDGFTAGEMDKFREAVKTFSKGLLDTAPFTAVSDKFNCWLVEAPSLESGTDIPAKGIYKNTLLSTSFYTFDSERYNMTYDIKSVRDVAANVPYDIICTQIYQFRRQHFLQTHKGFGNHFVFHLFIVISTSCVIYFALFVLRTLFSYAVIYTSCVILSTHQLIITSPHHFLCTIFAPGATSLSTQILPPITAPSPTVIVPRIVEFE